LFSGKDRSSTKKGQKWYFFDITEITPTYRYI
jgi:hypothetical protein